MATYEQLQDYVVSCHGCSPKTCRIAHVKAMSGLPVKRAWNRRGAGRQEPCPSEKVEPIREAPRRFGMIP